MTITYREKILILTGAMTKAEADLAQMCNDARNFSHVEQRNRAARVVQFLKEQRLRIEPARAAVMTPEQKADRKFARAFDTRMNRTVSWLRTNGIVKGAPGQRRKDGARVVFTSDPVVAETTVVIEVHYLDIDKHAVEDALQFKPDVTVPPKKKEALPKPAARRLKTAPAKTAAAK